MKYMRSFEDFISETEEERNKRKLEKRKETIKKVLKKTKPKK